MNQFMPGQRGELKPINRTKLRLALGKIYYTTKRYELWYFGNIKFAKVQNITLQYNCFSHKTPLLRELRDVDMHLQYNKIQNLKLAVKKLNGVVIYQGETLSYWELIGKPTKRKGYLEGMVLFCGNVKSGIGGGLCQLSNLIYWMTLHTPLTVVERYRHSFDVFPDSNRTQPFGSGATCVYNYRDLMIKNDTSQTFQLFFEVTEKNLIGCCKSDMSMNYHYEIYEKEHRMEREYWGGYSRHNELYRKVYDEQNNMIADEFVVENHTLMMYQPFIDWAAEENEIK